MAASDIPHNMQFPHFYAIWTRDHVSPVQVTYRLCPAFLFSSQFHQHVQPHGPAVMRDGVNESTLVKQDTAQLASFP